MHSSPEKSLYAKARTSMVSLVKEIVFSFLVFTLMLIITEGTPPQWLVGITFCVILACVMLEELSSGRHTPFLIVVFIEGFLLFLKFSHYVFFHDLSSLFFGILGGLGAMVMVMVFELLIQRTRASLSPIRGAAMLSKQATRFKETLSKKQLDALSGASETIQYMLKELEEKNPYATQDEKIKHINHEIPPHIRKIFVEEFRFSEEAAIGEFLEATIGEFLESQYVIIVATIIRSWINRGTRDTY
jgi:hypothetical protein